MKTEDSVNNEAQEMDLDAEMSEKELALYGRLWVMLMQIPHFNQFFSSNFDIRIAIDEKEQTIDWEISQVDMEVAARRLAGMLQNQPQPIVHEPSAEEVALLKEKNVV